MKITTILIIAALLISAVFVSGCVQLSNWSKQGAVPPENTVQEKATPEITAEETKVTGGECTAHADCYDTDECTTDACTEGTCTHTLESGCESKKVSTPQITAVQLGDKEWVEISAKNYRVDDWTFSKKDGTVFYTFPEYTTLNNKIKIYTGGGLSTTVEWYLAKKDFWSPGDTVVLKDKSGTVISEMQG